MSILRKCKWAGFTTICIVCLMIGLAFLNRPRRGLIVSFVGLKSSEGVAAIAEFSVSNSTGRLIGSERDVPQVWSNGVWKEWSGPPSEVFYLSPGQATNVTVAIPQPGSGLRVPFKWDYVQKPFQKIFPSLHVRFSNLKHTLKTSRSMNGWLDDKGYLSSYTHFSYVMGSNNPALLAPSN